eukprot:3644477-Lingulodinium_polyedra.AAC.1
METVLRSCRWASGARRTGAVEYGLPTSALSCSFEIVKRLCSVKRHVPYLDGKCQRYAVDRP